MRARLTVWIAAGTMTAQTGLALADGLAVLHAAAHSAQRFVHAVAADVVDGWLPVTQLLEQRPGITPRG